MLFQPSHGPLLLFYKVGTGPQTWLGMLMSSKDRGQTWTKPTRLPKGIYGPIKNKPLELEDGTLLCPSSSENDGWKVHFEATKDFGKTWTKTDDLPSDTPIGAIQPSILRMRDGTLSAVGRTQQGRLFGAGSVDHGLTWSSVWLLDTPNPNSGADAITLEDGRHLLVNNHSAKSRTPLMVYLSDDAEHWKPVLTLENSPGEYSYPSVIQAKDGTVHVVYTWKRQRIKHAVLRVK